MVGRASARSAPPKGWRSSARPHGASRASWREMGSAEVAQFLTSLAVERHLNSSTQNQALAALLFLYREVLGMPLHGIDAVRAKMPGRLPVVLTRETKSAP